MKKLIIGAMFLLSFGVIATPAIASHFVFPSTNDQNRTAGWAHVDVVDVGIGEITLDFISTRAFASCFEMRSDGDTSEAIDTVNFNPDAHDLYPFLCVNNQTTRVTIDADQYVEIRSVFGAESDERFDWTSFDVLLDAQTKDDCHDGGWEAFGFSNQGQCIRFVASGTDSR